MIYIKIDDNKIYKMDDTMNKILVTKWQHQRVSKNVEKL